MKNYQFHLVNVFAETHFGGNPLAVFPHADGLNDEQMQAIAKQFNLSETVFIFPPTDLHGIEHDKKAVANLRIFTPNYEMPLAGHPTLGSAFILHKLNSLPNEFTLNTLAKPVSVQVNDNHVTLQIRGYDYQQIVSDNKTLAKIFGISESDIYDTGYFINSGTRQLLIQLTNVQVLQNIHVDLAGLRQVYADNGLGNVDGVDAYFWVADGEIIHSRLFFEQNKIMVEDSGTGSACANLGAYHLMKNLHPVNVTIHQGDYMGRPNRLTLQVDSEENILVGGKVIEVGKGEFYL
ncbi:MULTISPECIES: PhzF family phenazine biosynthesis protein [unclassified Moraxella]|uniref:PhzF family phenazine biosynthesis protein n=1 Tax=unclassified Moraxella TaxID=2685852 RepID=UPI003AF9ECA2